MTRRTNVEAKQAILKTAYRLFLSQGYNSTSMASIAEKCNVSKSLVQKHFKKKEVFIHFFFEDLLNYADRYLEKEKKKSNNYWINLHLIGQLHYAFLLKDEGRKKFMLDIVSSRQLTDIIISLDVEWAFDYMHSFSEEKKEQLIEDMSLVMGGAYQLIYLALINDRTIDYASFQQKSLSLAMFLQGIPQEETAHLLEEHRLSTSQLKDALTYLDCCFDLHQ